jgi:hypothetical protein
MNREYTQQPSLCREVPESKPGEVLMEKQELVNSIDMKFRYIPPGTFWMGSPQRRERFISSVLRGNCYLS